MRKRVQQPILKCQSYFLVGLTLSACGGKTIGLDQSLMQNGEGDTATGPSSTRYNEIIGNDYDEVLFGSMGNDHIIAGFGDDQLHSKEGDDWLEGGNGNDMFYLSAGFHDIDGGSDSDTIVIDQSSSINFLNLNLSKGTLHFSNSEPAKVGHITSVENVQVLKNIDTVISISGANSSVSTAGGDDTIYAFADSITITTGRGDDAIFLKSSEGMLDGGSGTDLLLIDEGETAAVIVNLSEQKVIFINTLNKTMGVKNFENITLNNTTDGNTVIGDVENNVIVGSANNDTLRGGLGDDTLTGGTGIDIFVYTASDVGTSYTAIDTITDFEPGKYGDKFSLEANNFITSNSATIQEIDLSLPAAANVINGNSILLITNGSGFSEKSEVLHALVSNASYSNPTNNEVALLAVWFNRSNDTVDVSVVTDIPSQDQSFDQINTFIELAGKTETFIDELTSDNFIIT